MHEKCKVLPFWLVEAWLQLIWPLLSLLYVLSVALLELTLHCWLRMPQNIMHSWIYRECNYKVQTNYGHKFHIRKQEKNVHINMYSETFNLWCTAQRIHLQVPKMSSMSCNECLNTSHHGLPHPSKDARRVVLSLTGIHKLMVKCLFIINRGCIQ